MTLGNDHISDDDLVLFALQLLPEERTRAVMAHVQHCQQCRSEIARLQGDLAVYSMTADAQAPQPSSRDRFMRQIAREPRLAELPAFELKPTEFDLREQERLAHLPQPEPLAPLTPPAIERPREPITERVREPILEPVREPLADFSHDVFQSRPRNLTEDRYQDRAERDEADQRADRVEHAEHAEHAEDRRADRSEPVFSARQSRSLSLEAREDDQPLVPGPSAAEPMFAPRGSRTRGTRRDDDENLEVYREERRGPRRAPWVLAWTGWAVAAGCSFVAGLQLHQRQQMQGTMTTQQAKLDDMQKQTAHAQEAQTALSTITSASAMQVAMHATPAVKPATAVKGAPPVVPPEALAAYLANKGALVFIATHLEPVPAGKTYELWLLPANGQNPMPAGTFKPDAQGNASIVMPHLPAGVPAKGFGVTIENDGGSQTPTLPIVMS